MSEVLKTHYSLVEAAKVFGLHQYVFSKKIREGILRPPMRTLDGPGITRPKRIFPKKAFDRWVEEGFGDVEINPRQMMKGVR